MTLQLLRNHVIADYVDTELSSSLIVVLDCIVGEVTATLHFTTADGCCHTCSPGLFLHLCTLVSIYYLQTPVQLTTNWQRT